MTPTLSLGCGTWGGSSTTDNVNYKNLLNIKQVSRRRTPPQWFRVPTATFFNVGALHALQELPSHTTVVVTDSWTEERGVLADVRRHLNAPNVRIFTEVVPEPGEDVVMRGVELLRHSEPDLIVAVGGGSVIDAAKAMRLFYEHPNLTMVSCHRRSSTPANGSCSSPRTPTAPGSSASPRRRAPARRPPQRPCSPSRDTSPRWSTTP
jgi:acetaldehyde dehydrogenase/alcohol dehydrogenase